MLPAELQEAQGLEGLGPLRSRLRTEKWFKHQDPGLDLTGRREVYSLGKKTTQPWPRQRAGMAHRAETGLNKNMHTEWEAPRPPVPTARLRQESEKAMHSWEGEQLQRNLTPGVFTRKALALPGPVPRPPEGSSPPRQHLGNLGPAVAQHLVGLPDDAVLLLGPAGLLHLGIEVVVPALTALLPQPALQVLGNQCPLLRAILLNQLNDLGGKPL